MMKGKKGEGNWQERLLAWFDSHKRDLPWREDKPRNPYHVWISEIMLQQTRTEAVKPYFNSWMERFPNISAWPGLRKARCSTSGRALLLQPRQKYP